MTDTQATPLHEVTSDAIEAYLPDNTLERLRINGSDLEIGDIHTCVAIIGAYGPGDDSRDADLVGAAAESIVEWLDDLGVTFTVETGTNPANAIVGIDITL